MPLLQVAVALLIAQSTHKSYKSRGDFRVIGGLTLVAKAYCKPTTADEVWVALAAKNCPADPIWNDDSCLIYVATPFHDKAVQALQEQSASKHFKIEIDPEPSAIGQLLHSKFRHGRLFVTDDQLAIVRHALVTREPPTISPFISDKSSTRLIVFTPSGLGDSKWVGALTEEEFFTEVIRTSDTIETPFGSISTDMDPKRRFVRDSARSFHCADGFWSTRISFRSEGGWLKIASLSTHVEAE